MLRTSVSKVAIIPSNCVKKRASNASLVMLAEEACDDDSTVSADGGGRVSCAKEVVGLSLVTFTPTPAGKGEEEGAMVAE